MSFESHSITLKIWDHSTIDHTLDAAIAQVSTRTNLPAEHIKVTRSGPNLFTVSPAGAMSGESLL